MKQKLLLSFFIMLTATTAWAYVEINKATSSDGNTSKTAVEADSQPTYENISISSKDKHRVFCSKNNLDFTGSELRAYIATGFDESTNNVIMTRVYEVPAGTGLLLVSEPGMSYKIPCPESVPTIEVNLLKATMQWGRLYETEGDLSNYSFNHVNEDDPYFYSVVGWLIWLPDNEAYLQLPTGLVPNDVKIHMIFDPIDGIVSPLGDTEDGAIYDLSGHRLSKMQRGLNIVNGRKILK